jgi:hypothetical protein
MSQTNKIANDQTALGFKLQASACRLMLPNAKHAACRLKLAADIFIFSPMNSTFNHLTSK